MSSSFNSSLILYFLIQMCLFSSQLIKGCLISDRNALLQFRSHLNDPENRLSTWQGAECCSWRGVSCDNQTGSVTAINLRNPYPNSATSHGFWNLSGTIDPSLLHLKSLAHLDLSYNTFKGIQIPQFFGSLKELRYLNLSEAGFTGAVPPQIGNLTRLQHLDLSSTHHLDLSSSESLLTVDDFQWVSKLASLEFLSMNSVDLSMAGLEWFQALNMLSSLRELHVSDCQASGISKTLPLINLTSLQVLDLSFNTFNSVIPNWVSNLTSLRHLDLQNADFHGEIPELWTISSSLKYIDMSMNNNLTADITELFRGNWKQLEILQLGSNGFHGFLPDSVGNLTSLVELNLFDNNIVGGIPSSIGKICNLKGLNLDANNLNLGLPGSLEIEGCLSDKPLQSLDYFSASVNKIGGRLPNWLGELANLTVLNLAYNMITGSVPPSLGNLSLLTELRLDGNMINGTLPSLSSLVQLQTLQLSNNGLSGLIPQSLQNCTSLETLDLGNNNLSGSIPVWLGNNNYSVLRILILRSNKLTGPIPFQHSDLQSLQELDLANNLLSGEIPGILGDQKAMINTSRTKTRSLLTRINLSGNSLSAEIPQTISSLSGLIMLNLSKNNLTGDIPSNIGDLHSLEVLDLSNNHFIGSLPVTMSSLTFLRKLNLSNNNFSGRIPPRGQLSTFAASSYSGNRFLCGPPLENDCEENGVSGNGVSKEDDGEDDNNLEFGDEWFYLSAGVGYAVGLLGLVAVVFIRKPWCDSYLEFIDWLVYRFHI